MYLRGPNLIGTKKKLEKRDTMKPYQYFDCFLQMVLDPTAQLTGNVSDYLTHLQQVSEDLKNGRAWDGIRRWSQHILDMIDLGEITWSDQTRIYFERVKDVYTVQPNNNQARNGQVIPCRDYNAGECSRNGDHSYGDKNLVHCCSYCIRRRPEGAPPPRHKEMDCITKQVNARKNQNFHQNGFYQHQDAGFDPRVNAGNRRPPVSFNAPATNDVHSNTVPKNI